MSVFILHVFNKCLFNSDNRISSSEHFINSTRAEVTHPEVGGARLKPRGGDTPLVSRETASK